ncbi:MAG: acyl--CoA ligase [Proteobacteria bacterium]|nr:acyl--CoA ligase [Pseudomonadota bacterium]
MNRTLGEVLESTANRWPDKLALVGDESRLTWSELNAEADRLAGLFLRLGIRRGDAVGLCLSKRPEMVVAFLGLARLGAVAAPVNFKLHSGHIEDLCRVGSLRAMVLEPRFDAVIEPLLPHLAPRLVYVGAMGKYEGVLYSEDAPSTRNKVAFDDPVYFNYTSGTTGRPKGAVATHANILWNAVSGVDTLGFYAEDVFLCMFSAFSHPHEQFHRSLVVGATSVMIDTLSPRIVAQAIEKHRITWMMAVPSFYEMMLAHVGPGQFDVASLRVLEAGGAWCSAEMLERLERMFKCNFMPVWGSTETSGVVLALTPEQRRAPTATGMVVDHYEVKIVDSGGEPVPVGETGEMLVRGPGVCRSYVNMPHESKVAFADGWYRTSDLVHRDEAGFFWFDGRKTDLLKVGGIRVFPLEIERVIGEHRAVAEVVVVRAEERLRGETPRAIVVLKEKQTLSASALRAFCRRRLANYKVPRQVEFWAELPRLPNGKVDRQTIRGRRATEAD